MNFKSKTADVTRGNFGIGLHYGCDLESRGEILVNVAENWPPRDEISEPNAWMSHFARLVPTKAVINIEAKIILH